MKVFVDLDDVCNDFVRRFLQLVQRQLGETIPYDSITTWGRFGDPSYLELMQTPGFFRHLGIATGCQQALQIAQADGHEVFILSSAGPWNFADKSAWIEQYLPFISYRNVIYATCKGEVGGPGKLLIDDGPHNLADWEQAGGVAVAFSQPWNATWIGYRIKAWHELAHFLKHIEEAQSA